MIIVPRDIMETTLGAHPINLDTPHIITEPAIPPTKNKKMFPRIPIISEIVSLIFH